MGCVAAKGGAPAARDGCAMVAHSESLADLFAQLDAASAALREEERSCGREKTGPRVPHIEDAFLASETWRPPLWKAAQADAKALFEAGHRQKPAFVSTARQVGEFSSPGFLPPKIVDGWVATRVMQPTRTFSCPKGFKGYAGSVGTDLPQPNDDMCSEQHRTWLDKHYVQRDAHLYPAYTALERVDRIQEAMAKSELEGNRTQTEALQKRLVKAQSDPALSMHSIAPEGVVKHLYSFAGPDRAGNSFQQSYPWQAVTEERELFRQRLASHGARAAGGAASLRPEPRGQGPATTTGTAPGAALAGASRAAAASGTSSRSPAPATPLPARPPTGRPPTGAMGTSGVDMRPRTGNRNLMGTGTAVLSAPQPRPR